MVSGRVLARLALLLALCAPLVPGQAQPVDSQPPAAPPFDGPPFDTLPFAATPSFSERGNPESYGFPTGPSVDHAAPPLEQVEGEVTRRAWQVEATGTTSLQLLSPMRAQLQRTGWEVVLDCDARACGGFDFRFALDVIPAPAMNVDLFDFRALTARRGAARVFLLVSHSGNTGYVQMTHAAPGGAAPLPAPSAETPVPTVSGLLTTLRRDGHAALDDLRFATGEVALEETPAPSLSALADFLRDTPGARLLLVGHTDSEGPLDTNSALSQRRAEAVRQKLIDLGVAPDRLEAHGVGYLAPRASNGTEAGRRANRRVEAVLMDTP